jgi:hypothetical protein
MANTPSTQNVESRETTGQYGNVPSETVDRIFNGFLNVVTLVFEHMTPGEIADQIELIDQDDMIDTFKAVTQLPQFKEWASTVEGGKVLFDLVSK